MLSAAHVYRWQSYLFSCGIEHSGKDHVDWDNFPLFWKLVLCRLAALEKDLALGRANPRWKVKALAGDK